MAVSGDLQQYKLVVCTAGEGFADKTAIEADDALELQPTFRTDANGVVWERYGSETDYIEFRAKHVWYRQLFPLSTGAVASGPEAEAEAVFRHPEPGDPDMRIRGG